MGDGRSSVLDLVARAADAEPADAALLAPGRAALSHGGLHALVCEVAGALRATGVGPDERVALVVPNGAEAATAFLASACAATCAPLNPAYTAAELDFYLSDLRARAVLVSAELDSPVREVAAAREIPVLELERDEAAPAGTFSLPGSMRGGAVEPPRPDATALVLHTSGTTARPKLVPLTHRNLTASARNVASVLRLTRDDRCLNVMPLFHIHGLVAALLGSLSVGGSVVCAPGFHQLRFFDWLRELEPTWYTAVPTMHQAILARLRERPGLATGHALRFARSSSASLPVPVLHGLEEALGVPVVEAYGMTEAAHQMASNPLPPDTRKPGAVGRAAGPELAILGRDGAVLPQGAIGEVAIRGENVFAGYEHNPQANADAFAGGWFRTGDEGSLDEDGYLVLRGRLKELINRAGEKISPLEVDAVLLRHAGVEQAVTFALPHPELGEDVAAAVVLTPGVTVDERELQDFAVQELAPFKVPRRIVVVDEIPKGSTGKLQRIGLAEQLDVTARSPGTPQGGDTMLLEELRRIWADVLELGEPADRDADFFALGGDSILGAEAVGRVRELIGRLDLPLVSIVRAPTPAAMAVEVEQTYGWTGHGVQALRAEGTMPPLFLVHPVDGEVVRFASLAVRLDSDRPFFGIRARGPGDGGPLESVEAMAAEYLEGIRAVQPSGPYLLGGFCMGAAVALELTHRIEAAGERVGLLLLIDPRLARPPGLRYAAWLARRRARQRRLLGAVARRLLRRAAPTELHDPEVVWESLAAAREAYVCRRTDAAAALILSEDFDRYEIPLWYLRRIFPATVSVTRVPGIHTEIFREPGVDGLADAVNRVLARSEAP